MTHEQAYLIPTSDGPVLRYVMEATDHKRASEAFRDSTFPIDLEHKAMMAEVLAESVEATPHYDVSR